MGPELIVTIIFGCVAVVGVVIGFLAYRKQNPKKIVEYRINVLSLMRNTASLSNRLEVSFDEKKVSDPHLVEVSIRATGRMDIRRADFDGGLPLEFDLGSEVVRTDDDTNGEVFRLRGNFLEFMPNLIPRKHGEFSTSFLCSGRPNVKLTLPHPLADTTVKNGSSYQAPDMSRVWIFTTGVSVGFIGLLIVFWIYVVLELL